MYSTEQKEEFLSLAQEVGIAAAIKELNYPKSRATAQYWVDQYNVDIPIDDLKSKAAKMKHWYTEREQHLVLSAILERILETTADSRLPADQLTKLARAAKDVVETMRLIGGQSTQTIQSIDSLDAEINGLLNQFKM